MPPGRCNAQGATQGAHLPCDALCLGQPSLKIFECMGTGKQHGTNPLVSVIVPAYNAERYLARALASVLDQTYTNMEILVVDDGSTDSTREVAQRFAKVDSRVYVLCQKNSGVAAARNEGIRRAQGEWIAPLDADDIWHPHKIERQVYCAARSAADVGLVYAWSVDVDEYGRARADKCVSNIEGWVLPTLICHNFLGNASAPLIRRDCLEQVGLYDTRYKTLHAQGCEDWDLYLRLAQRYHFKVVPAFLVGYRKSAHSMSRNFEQMARSHSLLLEGIKTRHPQAPSFVYRVSRGNLYTYFARNSNAVGEHWQAMFWLKKSVKADWITPFLRLTLYQLLAGSLFGLLRGHTPKQVCAHTTSGGESDFVGFPEIKDAGAIGLEVWRDRVFHRAIMFFYRVFAAEDTANAG